MDMRYEPKECVKRIASLRKNGLGLTQMQAAERLNISYLHYSAIETGRRGASIDLLIDIAALFHSSLEYIILGKEGYTGREEVKTKLNTIIEELKKIDKEL